MSRAVAASMTTVCILAQGTAISHAQPDKPRRPVAVIALGEEEATIELAKKLDGELRTHNELQPVIDNDMPDELYGPLRNDDAETLARAAEQERQVDEQLSNRRFELAANTARTGLDLLLRASPATPVVVEAFARLAFAHGAAQFRLRKVKEAQLAFALAHRVDPKLAPDPARYIPEILAAFDAAKASATGTLAIEVSGSGRTWIDGTLVGTAPGTFEVTAGPHVVWLTGEEHVTRGREFAVEPGKPTSPIEITPEPAPTVLRVARARAALRTASDATARAAAMRQLAELLAVKDAILLTVVNGKIVVQTWRADTSIPDKVPGFSAHRELKDEAPGDLLAPLGTLKKREPPEDIIAIPFKPVEHLPWWKKRRYQVAAGAGVLAVIYASVRFIGWLTDDTVPLNPDTQVGRFTP